MMLRYGLSNVKSLKLYITSPEKCICYSMAQSHSSREIDTHYVITVLFNPTFNKFISKYASVKAVEIVRTGGLMEIKNRDVSPLCSLAVLLENWRTNLVKRTIISLMEFEEEIRKLAAAYEYAKKLKRQGRLSAQEAADLDELFLQKFPSFLHTLDEQFNINLSKIILPYSRKSIRQGKAAGEMGKTRRKRTKKTPRKKQKKIQQTVEAQVKREPVKCSHCGKPIEGVPFTCRHCGKVFCVHHHLPENHNCPALPLIRQPRVESMFTLPYPTRRLWITPPEEETKIENLKSRLTSSKEKPGTETFKPKPAPVKKEESRVRITLRAEPKFLKRALIAAVGIAVFFTLTLLMLEGGDGGVNPTSSAPSLPIRATVRDIVRNPLAFADKIVIVEGELGFLQPPCVKADDKMLVQYAVTDDLGYTIPVIPTRVISLDTYIGRRVEVEGVVQSVTCGGRASVVIAAYRFTQLTLPARSGAIAETERKTSGAVKDSVAIGLDSPAVAAAFSELNRIRRAFNLPEVSFVNLKVTEYRVRYMRDNDLFSHYDAQGIQPAYYFTYLDGGQMAFEENLFMVECGGSGKCNINVVERAAEGVSMMVYNDASSLWGHRDSLLDPCNNKVSIAAAWSDSKFYMAVHMVADWVNWVSLPSYRNGVFSMKGYVSLPPPKSYGFYPIIVYKDKPDPAKKYKSSYDYGAVYAIVVPPDKIGYYYPGALTVYAERYVLRNTGSSWYIEAEFSLPVSESGIYTIEMYSENVGIEWQPKSPAGYARNEMCTILTYSFKK